MKKGNICIVFALIFVMSFCAFASATYNTTVVVHGPPFHHQIVRIIDPTIDSVVDSIYPPEYFSGVSNDSFVTTLSKVKFLVIDRYNGQTISSKDFSDEYTTGGVVDLWIDGAMNYSNNPAVITSTPVVSTNVSGTVNSTSNAANNENSTSDNNTIVQTAMPTGFLTSIKNTFNGFQLKYVYYFLGIVAALVVIMIVFVFGRKAFRDAASGESGPSFVDRPDKPKTVTTAAKIVDAEKRISKAQEEIDELKEREIRRTERRLAMLQRLGKVQDNIDRKQGIPEAPETQEVKEVQEETKPWPETNYENEATDSNENRDEDKPSLM